MRLQKKNEETQGTELFKIPLMPQDFKYTNPDNGIVLLEKEIDTESASKFVDDIYYASSILEEKEPIIILINSPGGFIYDAIKIIDAINSVSNPTIGLCQGVAGSGAFYAFQACTERVMFENSLLFWHEMIQSDFNLEIKSHLEVQRFAENYKKINEHLINFFKKRRKISKEQWEKTFKGKNDIWFTAQDALKLDLTDYKISKIKELKRFFKEVNKKNE